MQAIILDKTRPQEKWFRSDIQDSVKNAISELCSALAKTPIYNLNERREGVELVSEAEIHLKRRLSHLSDLVVYSEKLFSEINPQVKSKDRADLVVTFSTGEQEWLVIIEYDAARADQVAKKFVSRVAQIPHNNTIYIACCYSGTRSMSLSEVNKYFSYISSISESMKIAGFIGMAPPKNRG